MKTQSWTLRVILKTDVDTSDADSIVETLEEELTFDGIKCSEEEIKKMISSGVLYTDTENPIVVWNFPEGYDIRQFTFPLKALLHYTLLAEIGDAKKEKNKTTIEDFLTPKRDTTDNVK